MLKLEEIKLDYIEKSDDMKMSFGKLLLLFTIVPFVELFLLLEIANRTSTMFSLGLIIATGVLGAHFAKVQGRSVIKKIQAEMSTGAVPGNELIHGLCVLIGGILLLTPGILTDIFGFSLLIPFTRYLYIGTIKKIIDDKIKSGSVRVYTPGAQNVQTNFSQQEPKDDYVCIDEDE